MASDITKTIKEESRKKKQQGILDRMNAQPHQQDVGGRASRLRRKSQEADDRLARLDAGKPNEEVLEKARRTRIHTTGNPYRKNPEEVEEKLRWDEDRFGAKAGTGAFGSALATEYAERRGFDTPGEAEDTEVWRNLLDNWEATLEERGKDVEAEVAEEIEVETTPAVEEPAYKQTARRLAADLKKDGTTTESWEAAKQEVADRGARYRDALQSPDAWKRDIDAKRMAEVGEVGDVVGAKDSGFEEEYDATTKFQEEEYKSPSGGGSIERDRMLAEIMGQGYQTDPDSGEDTELYEKYYAEAKEKNTEASEKEIQDMAIKKWVANRSRKAELAAKKFPKPLASEATETVAAGLRSEQTLEEMEAEDAERLKKEKEKEKPLLSDDAKKRLKAGGADTPRQLTDAERAARIAMQVERDTKKDGTIDYTRTSEQEDAEFSPLLDEVIEDTVDETTTDEVPSGASADLYDSLTPEQRLPMERQPQGVNLGAALEGLTSKDLAVFNSKFGSTYSPGFLKGPGGAHNYSGREDFASKLSPELKASMAKELKSLVEKTRSDLGEALTVDIRDTLFKKWGAEKGYLSEEEGVRLGSLARRISGILQDHAAPAHLGGSGISEDARLVINQLLKDAGGDFLHPRDWFGRKTSGVGSPLFGGHTYGTQLPTPAVPLLDAIDEELLRLPGWKNFADIGRGESNLNLLGLSSQGPPAVLEAGEDSFEEILKRVKGGPSAAPEEGGVTDTEVTQEMVDAGYTGQGAQTWASGSTYEGGFKDGKRTGQGTYTWADGNTYEGDFKDDKRTGQGTYTWADGGTYEGAWKDSKRTGQGTYTWADGNTYEGDFKDGKRTGQGTYTWADGTTYVGDWKDGEITGQGTKTNPNGTIVEKGQWENGTLLDAEEDIADGIEGEMDTP